MENMEDLKCKKCGMAADSPMSHKCDICRAESKEHDEKHECGSEHCVVKCAGCKEAETKCSC